jgi:DNA-binding response OmpR family regulator
MLDRTKILIIEDDETASFLMQDFLENQGFTVSAASNVTDGLSLLNVKKYDLLLLDLNLPDFSGFELLSKIKKSIAIPTIIVSAYSDTPNKVKAFRYGADDYLVKPIDFEELEARIWVLLSRYDNIKLNNSQSNTTFKVVDTTIFLNDNPLELTTLEYDILAHLINRKNCIVSRDELTDAVTSVSSHRLLDNHIKNIRKKIESDSHNPKYLKTVYGTGYKLIF